MVKEGGKERRKGESNWGGVRSSFLCFKIGQLLACD